MPITTILYIEDNDDNAYMLSRRLKKRGFNVVTSADGKSGVEAAQKLIPDIILMDLNLPIIDGLAATKLLKSNEPTAHIPIIVVSSHALPGERETSIEAGCDEYETKPINFDSLLSKINQFSQ